MRVNTTQMSRLAGTPAVMYGVGVQGVSGTLLRTVRSTIARAAAPEAGGKNPDCTLYALDGATGTLDPAFDAHVLPVKHWALAWWESWICADVLESSFAAALDKLNVNDKHMWSRVTGPCTALIASL